MPWLDVSRVWQTMVLFFNFFTGLAAGFAMFDPDEMQDEDEMTIEEMMWL